MSVAARVPRANRLMPEAVGFGVLAFAVQLLLMPRVTQAARNDRRLGGLVRRHRRSRSLCPGTCLFCLCRRHTLFKRLGCAAIRRDRRG